MKHARILVNNQPVHGIVQGDWIVLDNGERAAVDSADYLCPIEPRQVLATHLTYRSRCVEYKMTRIPDYPAFFIKPLNSVSHHNATVARPRGCKFLNYEGEVAIVIGKRCKNVSIEEALDYVAGYTCGNDISARDWQKNKPSKQWLLGKSFDTFAPCGPVFVTADEVGNAENLRIQLRLNGQTMQDSTTAQLIYGIAHLVSYLSQVVTLEPGDLIYTGTPPGVGMARKPPVFLKPGDLMHLWIEKLGEQRQTVHAWNPALIDA